MPTNPPQSLEQRTDETFLDYFKKNKGVYSHNDVEKIVKQERSTLLEQITERVENARNTARKGEKDDFMLGGVAAYEDVLNMFNSLKEEE